MDGECPKDQHDTAIENSTRTIPTKLSVFDASCLIVGIVIASSIFESPPLIFSGVSQPIWGLALWVFGGVLALVGAFVYAELATTYPRLGGDYVYLSRAFGPWCGFWFAWSQLVIIQPASVGALSYVAAKALLRILGARAELQAQTAAGFIVLLTVLNMLGLKAGAWVQNILTLAKLMGLSLVVFVGCLGYEPVLGESATIPAVPWTLALILVIYAYGGWNDAALVAAEVYDVRRNLPRALLGGICVIALMYLLVNVAYLKGLGWERLKLSTSPAADLLRQTLGTSGEFVMLTLVLLSALGGLNGLILSVSRLHASVGQDHALWRWLAWHPRGSSPIMSLFVQAVISVITVLIVGTPTGRLWANWLSASVGAGTIPWEHYHGGFETLVAGSAPFFWCFFSCTGIAFFVLRWREPHIVRSFHAPGYPWLPMTFVVSSLWMLYASVIYAWSLMRGFGLLWLFGLILYGLGRRKVRPSDSGQREGMA